MGNAPAPIDWNAAVKQFGGTVSTLQGQPTGDIDWNAEAQKMGASVSNPIPNDPHWLAPELGHVAVGVAKGAGQTVEGVSKVLNKVPVVGEYLAPTPGVHAAEEIETPHGLSEGVGVGIENILEFVAGDEALKSLSVAEKLGMAERIWAKVGETALRQAVIGGTQAGLHGGSPALGAAAGALGGGTSELAAAKLAPPMMEAGLGIGWQQRARNAHPGIAALEGTRGLTPAAISKSAKIEIQTLTARMESMAAHASQPADLQPALDVLKDARDKAIAQNDADLFGKVNDLTKQLTEEINTKATIPTKIPARRAIDLKRGLQSTVKTWTPTKGDAITGIAKQTYGAIDEAVDSAAPGTKEINDQIHSLIPVRDRAMVEDLKAGIIQQVVKRLTSPTGALALPITGAIGGGREYGTPGAIAGGLLGLAGANILASPTTLITLARLTGRSQTAVGAAVRAVMAGYEMSNQNPAQ